MRFRLAPLATFLLIIACSGGGDTKQPTQPITPTTPTAVLTSVTLTTPAQSLTVGGTMQLTAAPKDQGGNAIAAAVTWTSSAGSVATVSGSGFVNALAPGSTAITATASAGGVVVSSNTLITVNAPAPVLTSVTVSAPATSLTVGATTQLSASPKDQNGSALAAAVTWSSSAPGVASVGAGTGLVSAVAPGTATITASAAVGNTTVTGTVPITVTAATPTPVLTSVTVSPSATTIFIGDGLTLTASPKDQNGAAIAATVIWSSASTAIATVNPSTGAVNGVSAGIVTITAAASIGNVTRTGVAQITVAALPVLTSVSISGSNTVGAGAQITLTATPRDQNGSAISATVTWSSNAPGVATVNPTTGLTTSVTGVSAGPATMTASATSGGVTKTATMPITVTGGFPLALGVSPVGTTGWNPSTADVAVGGTVTWTLGIHGITFDSPPSAVADIPVSPSGARTFSVAGTYNYHCVVHGLGMAGAVVVH